MIRDVSSVCHLFLCQITLFRLEKDICDFSISKLVKYPSGSFATSSIAVSASSKDLAFVVQVTKYVNRNTSKLRRAPKQRRRVVRSR